MRYCGHCGKEIHEEAVRCVHCGKDLRTATISASQYASADRLACVLCLLFPIFGFILFATNEQSRPAIAKTYLNWSLGSYILVLIIAVIVGIVLVIIESM